MRALTTVSSIFCVVTETLIEHFDEMLDLIVWIICLMKYLPDSTLLAG